jgi:tRNA(Ile)-lysidine synthase
VLPLLEQELGPGVAAALARTADQLREDAEALDAWAERAYAEASAGPGLDAGRLAALPVAVALRVVRLAALAAGSPASELFRVHVLAVADLLTGGTGRQVQLPGHVTAYREGGAVRFGRTPVGG